MRNRWKLCRGVVLTAALVFGLRAGAVPVHIALDWPAGAPATTPVSVHIQAVRITGEQTKAAPVEADATPSGTVLDLDDAVWQIQASAPGYWSQQTDIRVVRQKPVNMRFSMWPATFIHGEFSGAEGDQPQFVKIQLSADPHSANAIANSSATAIRSEPTPSHAELNCPVHEVSWSCLAPAGLFDLRLEVAGYTPRYVWAMELKPAENIDLGRSELRRGGSVFGLVVHKDGSEPIDSCRALLQVDLSRRGGPGAEPENPPVNEPNFSVPLGKRGSFQFDGVMPGRHILLIECPEGSAFREIMVQADGETRLDPPVRLEEQVLDLALTPAVDPDGQPWLLTVEATSPRLRRIADRAALASDGHWSKRGLMAGNHHIIVSCSNGTTWLQRDVDVGAVSGAVVLHLTSQRVAGRVLLGSLSVRSKLLFANDVAGSRVALESGEDGRYLGLLPFDSTLQETSWVVDAHVTQPSTDRRLQDVNIPRVAGEGTALLDLVLPTIAVRGVVVSEEGEPQSDTQVTIEEAGGFKTTTSTDDAGNFQMSDLALGKYTAMAESPDGVSDRVPFNVTVGSESELKLIFRPLPQITFTITYNHDPVEDATVQVWTAPGIPLAFAHTDQNGHFKVKLPPGTTEVGLTVSASGHALKMVRIPVATDSDPSQTQDANTVTLDDPGGSLVLKFQPRENTLDNTAPFYLIHNRAIQDARTIASKGAEQAGASGDGSAEIDLIEPGNYALCLLKDLSGVAAIWQGILSAESCSIGTLEQGHSLTLQPK